MKKIVILAAVAFLVAAGAGTGVRIVITPKPADEAEAGEVHAGGDHAAAKPAHGATAAAPAHEPAAAEAEPAHEGTAETGHASPPAAAPTSVSLPAPGTAGGGNGSALQFTELGRILGGLEPEAAATFLAQVDDPTATRILAAMSVRQAVRVVDALPDDRGNRLWGDVMKSTGEK